MFLSNVLPNIAAAAQRACSPPSPQVNSREDLDGVIDEVRGPSRLDVDRGPFRFAHRPSDARNSSRVVFFPKTRGS